jgi:SAM-dependent methyltransferase
MFKFTTRALSTALVLTLAGVGCGDSGSAAEGEKNSASQAPASTSDDGGSGSSKLAQSGSPNQSGGDGSLGFEPQPTGESQAGSANQSGAQEEPDLDVPYVPTPDKVVQRMLDLAQVGPGDYVMDLGSGDGRIVIQAVQRGAYGHGVDLDPERVREARKNAKQAGVSDRVMFLQQDLFNTDVSQASVITMYLFPEVNLKMRPKLLKQLRPGTRVVSHAFDMGEWEPDKTVHIDAEGRTRTVYLWVIPADVSGQWQWQVNGQSFNWKVEQQFQKLDTTLSAGGSTLNPQQMQLQGRRVAFSVEHDGERYLFSGRAEGDTIKGTVQVRDGADRRLVEWTAEKQ